MIGNEIYGTSAEHDTILYHVNIVQILFCSMSLSLSFSLSLLVSLTPFLLSPRLWTLFAFRRAEHTYVFGRVVFIFISFDIVCAHLFCMDLTALWIIIIKFIACVTPYLYVCDHHRFTYTQFVLFCLCLWTIRIHTWNASKENNPTVPRP